MPPIDSGTVLITGACSGVGREIARLLSRRARTLVLVSPQVGYLDGLREELEREHPTLGLVLLPCDSSQPGQVDSVLAELGRHLIAVDVLVNAASLEQRGLFASQRWAEIERMLQVNVVAPMLLTHRLLGPMLARGRGGILHIGSGTGRLFLPGAVMPVATNGGLDGFLESLRLEVEGSGVVITQVVVGPLDDAKALKEDAREPRPFFQISVEQCALEALEGFERGAPLVYPGLGHHWMMTLLPMLPRMMRRMLGRMVARRLRGPAGAARPELPGGAQVMPSGEPVRA